MWHLLNRYSSGLTITESYFTSIIAPTPTCGICGNILDQLIKRKYGYFTLPILYNNALIGRLDPKAHRKEGIFEVKALHLEPGVVVDDALSPKVVKFSRVAEGMEGIILLI